VADVGGVGGPVACGEALPGDGDVGVDAQGAGEDSGGDLGRELEECGAAGLVGTNPKSVQPLSELSCADRSSRLAAGEEPGGRGQGSDGRVALAVSGRWMGALPRCRRTSSALGSMCSTVIRLIAAGPWA
jgi:hypothetical protein